MTQRLYHLKTWGRAHADRWLVLGFLVGLAIRGCLFFSDGSFDLSNFIKTARYPLFANVYADHPYYNYSPLWAWVCQLCRILADVAGLKVETVLRTFLLISDTALAYLVRTIARRVLCWPAATANAIAIAFYLWPLSIFVTIDQGQFDAVAILFVLLAFYGKTMNELSDTSCIILISVAIAIKQSAAIFVPVLASLDSRPSWSLALFFVSPLLFCLLLLPYYLETPEQVLDKVILYLGPGHSGFGPTLAAIGKRVFGWGTPPRWMTSSWTIVVLVGSGLLAYNAGRRERDFVIGGAVMSLGVVSLSWGTAHQYFTWVMPFILLLSPRLAVDAAGLWLLTALMVLVPAIIPAELVVHLDRVVPVPEVAFRVAFLASAGWGLKVLIDLLALTRRGAYRVSKDPTPCHMPVGG